MEKLSEMALLLTIIGACLILAGLLSLIYQFFSASTLVLAGIICLNISWQWFNWYWLIWFGALWLIAILSGFIITANESQKIVKNNAWMPVIGSLLGAIFIPIPFLGPLIGVFVGTICALCIPETKITQEKIELALSITFKCFLGLVLEVSAVITMLISTLFLALF